MLRKNVIFIFDVRIARKPQRLDLLGKLKVWRCGLKKTENISIIFSGRSNRSNFGGRGIFGKSELKVNICPKSELNIS